jgi:hypothetical protein
MVLSRCLRIRSSSELRVLQHRRHVDDADGTGAVRGRQLLCGWCQDSLPCRPAHGVTRRYGVHFMHALPSRILLSDRDRGAVRQQRCVLPCRLSSAYDGAEWLLQQRRRLELDTDERDGVSNGILLYWRCATKLPWWTLRQRDDANAVVMQWRVLSWVLLSRWIDQRHSIRVWKQRGVLSCWCCGAAERRRRQLLGWSIGIDARLSECVYGGQLLQRRRVDSLPCGCIR